LARCTAEELAGNPLSLIYIAGNFPDAQIVEGFLTDMGVDYTISLEPYTHISGLGGIYMGAFFYVPSTLHQQCRRELESRGLTDTVDLEDSGEERPHGT
jgi:hypothetical protein